MMRFGVIRVERDCGIELTFGRHPVAVINKVNRAHKRVGACQIRIESQSALRGFDSLGVNILRNPASGETPHVVADRLTGPGSRKGRVESCSSLEKRECLVD